MNSRIQHLLERIKDFPEEPGCYLMKNARGHIFYIGKAINLKNRVLNYFTNSDTRPFVSFLSDILYDIETIVVRNQTESLILERTLIRKHKPEYNVLLKDDKNYILLKLDNKKRPVNAPRHLRYPRLEIVRKAKNDQARYFGPYPSANQLRTTLGLINKFFNLRTCSDKVIDNRHRPCIQYQIGRCPAPCIQEIPHYSQEISNVSLFLQGKTDEITQRLKSQMFKAAEDENFETAARLRDQIEAVQESVAKQAVAGARKSNQDVFGTYHRHGFLAITRLMIRRGAVIEHQNHVFETHEFPANELLSSYLSQLYLVMDATQVVREIILDTALLEDADAIQQILNQRTHHPVSITWPKRGQKAALLKIAQRNAELALKEHMHHLTSQAAAVVALQKFLELKEPPYIMECFDISLFQGTDAVASKVCFVDGKAHKSDYRIYNIKTVEGMDDFAMLYEAICRRLKQGILDNKLPDLLLVDGGKGQLNSAIKACVDCGIDLAQSTMKVASIAKARVDKNAKDEIKRSAERIFLPGESEARQLPEHSPERYLVERIRDEAHRFAIERHRKKRSTRTMTSVLDTIAGIGPQRRKNLLRHFGSIKKLKEASVEELVTVPGISLELAITVHRSLIEQSVSYK